MGLFGIVKLAVAGIGMLLLFDGKGNAFVKELIRDGAADVDGTIHIGDQVTCIDVRICACARARQRHSTIKRQNL